MGLFNNEDNEDNANKKDNKDNKDKEMSTLTTVFHAPTGQQKHSSRLPDTVSLIPSP
jgi:hypothetical protein